MPSHSVYYYLGSWVIGVVSSVLSPLNTPNVDTAPVFNSNIFQSVSSALAAFQIVGDLTFMAEALGFLLGWKAIWLAVRLYRTVLELVPMMG